MKKCTFCGTVTDNRTSSCDSCGSNDFLYVCANCSAEYDGTYCPKCGVRRDAAGKTCPKCGIRFFTNFCPNCGYNPKGDTGTGSATNSRRGRIGTDPGKTALALSVAGLLTMLFPLSIAGLVMALQAKDENGKMTQMGKTSLAVSIVSVAVSVFLLILYVIGIAVSAIHH